VRERSVAATIHGRYLSAAPALSGPAPLLVGFHGYAEDAEIQLERLTAIPGSDQWIKVSIQGLHRFYQRRTNKVVASWMTRQDREGAISDNIAYVRRCLEAVAAEQPTTPTVVFAGFSQGVAMAFRAAVDASHRVAGVIAVGGDIPPEIPTSGLRHLSAALLVRGATDEFYSEEQMVQDERRLRESSVSVRTVRLSTGHEWPRDLSVTVSGFLSERLK
jgi:predicted esterase